MPVKGQSDPVRVVGLTPVAAVTDGTLFPELDGARDVEEVTIQSRLYALVAEEDDGLQIIDPLPTRPVVTTAYDCEYEGNEVSNLFMSYAPWEALRQAQEA